VRRGATLRARLTGAATAVVAVVLAASSVALVEAQRHSLLSGVEEALVQRADNLQPSVMQGPAGQTLPGEGDREDSFVQLIDARGRVARATPNLTGLPAVTAPGGGAADSFHDVALPRLSAHSYRVLTRPVMSGTLVVGKNVDDVQESVGTLTRSLAVAVPLVVLLLAGLLWWLTGRVLRPVESIRTEVAGIGAAELHRRVSVPRRDDEISRLASTMNAMLERVQQATDRQRQFVADASHELRNPLTRIVSALDVAAAHPRLTPQEQTLQEVRADTAQLQQLVDDLLLLARTEPGSPLPAADPVDLDDLVLDDAARLRQRGLVGVDTSQVGPARTTGDARQLARVIANLSSNAERYASSTVHYALRETADTCELVVADDGRGIPTEQRSAVFSRFVRLDGARSRDNGGVGLGLAIVSDIVLRHGGHVIVQPVEPHGARLVVTLPRAD
jgi:signal transduction histidine kinase